MLLWLLNVAFAGTLGGAVARNAEWFVDHESALERDDCSGLVIGVMARVGVEVSGGTADLWADAVRDGRVHHRSRPEPGDLAFFDDTYDKNGNGRVDDPLSHVAIVVRVDPDGTIVLIDNSNDRPVRELRMNLDRPDLHMKGTVILNDYLRARGYGSSDGPRMAGQLWRGFATPPSTAPVRVAEAPPPKPKPPPNSGSTPKASGRSASPKVTPTVRAVEVKNTRFQAARRARHGKRVRAKHLVGLSCDALWVVRNSAYARHGHDFHSPRAEAFFGERRWYEEVAGLDASSALTKRDLKNIRTLREHERQNGCPPPGS